MKTEQQEFIKSLVDSKTKITMKDFFKTIHSKFYPKQDISFMEYFLELTEHEGEFYVHHEKLVEYGIMSYKRSSDVKERLEALELVEDEEYQLRDIPQLRPQGGYSSKKIYMLTPESFKKCLMRSRKYPNQTVDPVIYCDYYLLLEKTYKLYTDYEKQLLNNQLEENQLQLEQNQQQLEENQKQLDEAKSKLRSETSKLKNQLRKTLEFNQATKKIEPTEYIYIVTTSQYQKTNKFKVGGCQSFDLIKSRLNQYNSGESDSHNHFFVYLRKTVSYKSIEHAISGMLMGFRENKSKELYFIHFDWLTKCIDAVMDGTAEFMLYVNENRDKIFEDTINMQPNISPPIQLEQIKIAYIRAGDEPKEIQIEANKFDDETIKLIREAIESYQSENNIIVRLKFEDHLKRTTNVKFEKKKRDVWKVVRQIGSALYPMWRYKY
jgi:parvulin-like peptidyl-prolyl isomerase